MRRALQSTRRIGTSFLLVISLSSLVLAGNPRIWRNPAPTPVPPAEACAAIDQIVACFGPPGTTTQSEQVVILLGLLKANNLIKEGSHLTFDGEMWPGSGEHDRVPSEACICINSGIAPTSFRYKLTMWHEGFHIRQLVGGQYIEDGLRDLVDPPMGSTQMQEDLFRATEVLKTAYEQKNELQADLAELDALAAAPDLLPDDRIDYLNETKKSFAGHVEKLCDQLDEIQDLLDSSEGIPPGAAWPGSTFTVAELRTKLTAAHDYLDLCKEILEEKYAEECG